MIWSSRYQLINTYNERGGKIGEEGMNLVRGKTQDLVAISQGVNTRK